MVRSHTHDVLIGQVWCVVDMVSWDVMKVQLRT